MSDFDKHKDQICKHKGLKQGNYYIGLDIGTNSVGWAATNEKYELLKFKSHKMWGSRLFKGADPAKETRMKRSLRRRYKRRKFRLLLLESLFAKEINAVDETFFMRLHESKYHLEDKTNPMKYTLFMDKGYTDVDYYKEFPTIYHLRHHLMTEGTKDVRLLFLVIHHILKYRGNFLYGKKEFSVDGEINEVVQATLSEIGFTSVIEDKGILDSVVALLLDKSIVRRDKVKQLELMIANGKKLSSIDKKRLQAWANLIVGLKAKLVELFTEVDVDIVEPDEKELRTISLDDLIYDDVRSAYAEVWGNRLNLVDQCKVLHDSIILSDMVKPGQSLSEAKIETYTKHKNDLALLKEVLKQDEKLYDDMFKADLKEGTNYVKYIKKGVIGKTTTTEKSFYSYIEKVLKQLPESLEIEKIKEEIKEKNFLPLQRINKNGVVPYQLHKEELVRILDKAKANFPFLSEIEDGLTVADKIISILEFKIPYYVGPLNPAHSIEKGGFAWVVRKEAGQVLPWNFEQKIDVQASAVKFIENLTNKCTYLIDQDVLPKYSLLYAEFSLLNELNNIRINGKPLPVDVKRAFIRDYFMSLQDTKTATKKVVAKYLVDNNYVSQSPVITGMDQQIATKLTSHRDMTRILGENFDSIMAEDIIRYITIFGESKDMLYQVLKNHYGERLTEEQIKKLEKLKYAGWGRLSKRFLSEIKGIKKNDDDSEEGSIIEHMRQGQENLMQLLSSSYTFIENVQTYVKNVLGTKEKSAFEMLEELSLSPMVKRSVWQTLRILDELVSIRKELPKKIFVEVTRTNRADKKRTKSRKKVLTELYEEIKEDFADSLREELAIQNEADLDNRHLYLYFTQLGRCMYSGKRIDIRELGTSKYDKDHIFPQSKTKDDSLDNLVLVDRTLNVSKTDVFPIDEEIRNKQCNFWKMLLDKGFISQKKYERLTRNDELSDDELNQFINRQIVSTNQSVKAVTTLLQQLYPKTEIVFVKAENVSDFRRDFGFIKVRSVNHHHHAKDAYLNIVVGNVYHEKFTKDFLVFAKNKGVNRTYNLTRMYDERIFSSNNKDTIIWDPKISIETVSTMMKSNDVRITRRSVADKGKLFRKEGLKKANVAIKSSEDKYLPIKETDSKLGDLGKYGGKTDIKIAEYVILKIVDEKNKEKLEIFPVPVYLLNRDFSDQSICDLYIKYYKGRVALKSICVIYRGLYNGSLINFEGNRLFLGGRTKDEVYVDHAIPLLLDNDLNIYIKLLEKIQFKKDNKIPFDINKIKTTYLDEPVSVTLEKNLGLYKTFMEKLSGSLFRKIPKDKLKLLKTTGYEEFKNLSLEDQVFTLMKILNLITNFIDKRNIDDLNINISRGTIGLNLTNKSSFSVITTSITGLYENEIKIK